MAESLLHTLIETLCCLPGVGRKSAQRMAFHLLERDREGGRRLGDTLLQAMQRIGQCERCRTLTEEALCDICGSGKRDSSQLCIVETPSELSAIEQATDYHGLYFVLHGRLSPLDGLGPRELGLDLLSQRLAEGEVEEIILADKEKGDVLRVLGRSGSWQAGADVNVGRVVAPLEVWSKRERSARSIQRRRAHWRSSESNMTGLGTRTCSATRGRSSSKSCPINTSTPSSSRAPLRA